MSIQPKVSTQSFSVKHTDSELTAAAGLSSWTTEIVCWSKVNLRWMCFHRLTFRRRRLQVVISVVGMRP